MACSPRCPPRLLDAGPASSTAYSRLAGVPVLRSSARDAPMLRSSARDAQPLAPRAGAAGDSRARRSRQQANNPADGGSSIKEGRAPSSTTRFFPDAEAAGQLRPRGDGAHGRQRCGSRAPLGQEAPQNEPGRYSTADAHALFPFHRTIGGCCSPEATAGNEWRWRFGCRS